MQGDGAPGASENQEELLSKLSEQLTGLDNDPNMQGVMEGMMTQVVFLYMFVSVCTNCNAGVSTTSSTS